MKKTHFAYYLLWTIMLLSGTAKSEILLSEEGRDTYSLNSYIEVAKASSNALSIEQLINNPTSLSFHPLKDNTVLFEPRNIYWSKFNITNQLPNAITFQDWVLKFSLTLTDIEVYVVESLTGTNSATQFNRSGFFVPPAKRTFLPTIKANVVKLTLLPQKNYTIYIKSNCERKFIAPEMSMQLIAADKYFTDLKNKKERNSIYLGLVLMMLIYNLILYFFFRDKAFLFYSIYLTGVVLYTSYNSGDLADWMTPLFFPETPQLIYYFKLAPYFGIMGYMTFVRSFLDLPKLLPSWNTFFKWLTIIAIPLVLIDAFLVTYTNYSYNISDWVMISYLITFVLSTFVFIRPLFLTGDKKAYFIIFGIIAMGTGVLLAIFSRIQSIDFSTFYFKVGSILEIIAFSLGLAYRQLLSEQERQQAKFQLIKSKLVQEQEQKEAERLKELDSIKSRLYTNITHEFRTPLTVIMGMVDQIEENDKAKNLIKRNSKNLLLLINQMLDLAKAEEGKLKLNLIHRDIANYIKYLTESFLSAAESKQISLNFYTETGQIFMDYDEQKIQHIIQNLLSNAIKFTPTEGEIILHVKEIIRNGNRFLQLKVKDSGIGISKEDLVNIFDRFYQSDNTSTRKVEGTGIGLALAKELVNLMKGEITVQSEIGVGSEFTIHLPILTNLAEIEKYPIPAIGKPNANYPEVEIPSDIHTIPIGFVDTTLSSSETPTALEILQEKPLLLLIEDNYDVLTYIQSCLEEDYTIQIARNGAEGIKKAFEIIPDIIISDVMMPIKDGFEVTETLKEDERTSHIPIILLTAKATQQDKLRGLKRGADAYLMKPFDKIELIIRLEKLVVLRKRLQEHYSKLDVIATQNGSKPSDAEVAFLQKLYEVIEANLAERSFSVPQIAQIMQMSQVQVYRKLKALTNETPTQHIRSIRMKKAMDLLRNSNMNISEIAYDLGFTDPNYFSRTFQQVYGQTPSSIRK